MTSSSPEGQCQLALLKNGRGAYFLSPVAYPRFEEGGGAKSIGHDECVQNLSHAPQISDKKGC